MVHDKELAAELFGERDVAVALDEGHHVVLVPVVEVADEVIAGCGIKLASDVEVEEVGRNGEREVAVAVKVDVLAVDIQGDVAQVGYQVHLVVGDGAVLDVGHAAQAAALHHLEMIAARNAGLAEDVVARGLVLREFEVEFAALPWFVGVTDEPCGDGLDGPSAHGEFAVGNGERVVALILDVEVLLVCGLQFRKEHHAGSVLMQPPVLLVGGAAQLVAIFVHDEELAAERVGERRNAVLVGEWHLTVAVPIVEVANQEVFGGRCIDAVDFRLAEVGRHRDGELAIVGEREVVAQHGHQVVVAAAVGNINVASARRAAVPHVIDAAQAAMLEHLAVETGGNGRVGRGVVARVVVLREWDDGGVAHVPAMLGRAHEARSNHFHGPVAHGEHVVVGNDERVTALVGQIQVFLALGVGNEVHGGIVLGNCVVIHVGGGTIVVIVLVHNQELAAHGLAFKFRVNVECEFAHP